MRACKTAVRVCMQVGILTTDTFPAFVCDLENRDAVQKLYQLKGLSPTQPLSILCASFSDISDYTQVPLLPPNPLASPAHCICALSVTLRFLSLCMHAGVGFDIIAAFDIITAT